MNQVNPYLIENGRMFFFADILRCTGTGKELSSAGPDRNKIIIEASKTQTDKIHHALQDYLQSNLNMILVGHRDCVSMYTNSYHMKP